MTVTLLVKSYISNINRTNLPTNPWGISLTANSKCDMADYTDTHCLLLFRKSKIKFLSNCW